MDKWAENLKSDVVVQLSSCQKILDEQIREHIQREGKIREVEGVFGDTFKNTGFVSNDFKDEKGIQMTFYGCSFAQKGDLRKETIDSTTITKRAFIVIADIFLKFKFSVLFSLIFSFKKTIKYIIYQLFSIYRADLWLKTYKQLSDFAPFPRELIRAGLKLAQNIPLEYEKYPIVENKPDIFKIDYREFRLHIESLFWCLGTFFQNDTAYYYRGQDPLNNLNKESLLIDPRKEINRLFDLAIEREQHIKEKFRLLKKLTIFLLIPSIKNMVVEYLLELDLEQIKPDKADIYFNARKHGYNFRGESYGMRSKRADLQDKELGHCIFK